jgi:hypothetical protein
MTDQVVSKNIGALITAREGSTANTLTAAGSGDNTTKTGIAVDREALSNGSPPESMVASVLYDAVLASGATLSVAITVSDSADNSSFAAYATETAVVVATGPSGGGTLHGQHNLAVNLSSARRYVRVDHVPDLSAGGTDTAVTRAVGIYAGFDRLAAPA